METLPVIFRKMRGKQYESDGVTAVFPTLAWDIAGNQITVYAHIGQHGGASYGWYWSTRAARPDEYQDLLRELRGIYESGPDAVKLEVRQRMTSAMRATLAASARRYRESVA